MKRSGLPASYRVAWTALAVTMFALLVVWGMRIGSSLGVEPEAAQTPTVVVTAAPQIATVYSNIGPPDPESLCAELSPTPKQVTVESTSGVVIETVQCTS